MGCSRSLKAIATFTVLPPSQVPFIFHSFFYDSHYTAGEHNTKQLKSGQNMFYSMPMAFVAFTRKHFIKLNPIEMIQIWWIKGTSMKSTGINRWKQHLRALLNCPTALTNSWPYANVGQFNASNLYKAWKSRTAHVLSFQRQLSIDFRNATCSNNSSFQVLWRGSLKHIF